MSGSGHAVIDQNKIMRLEGEVKQLRNRIEQLKAALADALALAGVWDDNHPIKQRARRALEEKI
jgi:hypothetical protein